MRWRWLLFSFLFVLSIGWTVGLMVAHAADDGVTVTLTASQPTLTVGDVVTLTLQVTHTADAGILPVAPARAWGDFEVRSLSSVTTEPTGKGSATSRQRIGVTLWMTGTYGTPPLAVTVVDGAGQQHVLPVAPISLTVTSVLTSTDRALRELKPQATLPIPPLWPWFLGIGTGLLLLGGGSWWLYRRRRTRPPAPPVVVPDLRPAYQIALDELAQIQGLQLLTQRRFKEHYTLATDALRRYLAGAFAIPAIDQTTAEIRQALKQTTLPPEQKSHLITLLSEADLVKFAGVTPALEEAEQLLTAARAFVLATKPVSIPPTDNVTRDNSTKVSV